MTYNFTFHSADQCLPLSRNELLSEVLVERLYGEVTNVWHCPGHIFITTDNGRKLFTFDSKPIHPQYGMTSSSLDIRNSSSSIVDVILVSPTLVLVVEGNGHTQWWRYTQGLDWYHVGNMELCSHVDSSVVSLTYLPLSKMLIWCEQGGKQTSETPNTSIVSDESSSSFCIKGKTISSTTDLTSQKLRELEVIPEMTLVNNCPACDVYALDLSKLIIQSKVEKDQITITLVCHADLDEVSLFVGQEKFDVKSPSLSSNSLDFSSLLLKHLPTIFKMEANHGDLGVKTDNQRLVALSSCGLMEIFVLAESNKTKLEYCVVPISFEDSSVQYGHWFLHRRHIGIFYHQKLCLYSTTDGSCVSEWVSDDLSDIAAVIQSSSLSFLAWIVIPKGLMALQATDSKIKTTYTSVDNLPDDDLLQTAVLQLVHSHELKHKGYDKAVLNKLQMLKQAWNEGKGSHQSQIVDMLAPLLDEYWRLDSVSQTFMESKELSQKDSENHLGADRFTEELTNISTLSRRAGESRLLWLSQIYPTQLLFHLCRGITLDCEEVIESEFPKWQALLGIEGWDLFRFEIVCRLLFQHHPEKLFHFVKCAESVSEQTIGVSAFIRKKHCLIFYRSATECLPSAETSCNPSVAAAAQGKLIIASEGDNCLEQALKHLLHHKLWQEALDLVKTQSTQQDQLPCYLYMTMAALAQNHALSDFISQIFELMPSWKSFLSFTQLASMQPEIRQHQLSTSASDIFCQGEPDVSLGSVKPFLTELIKKMENS